MDQRPECKTIKLLNSGENKGVSLHDIGFGKRFLNVAPEYEQQKKKNR